MLLKLYIAFFKVGAFSFGGGLAALPLIQQEIVEKQAWISLNDFTDLISIAQMTPGPIGINSATFVGINLQGILGAIFATLGFITPAIILVTLLAFLYFKYRDLSLIQSVLKTLRPAVVALIASAGITILKLVAITESQINYVGLIIFIIALLLLRKYRLNPILIMFSCGIIGGIIYYFI